MTQQLNLLAVVGLGSLLLAGGGRWILPFPVFLVLLEIKIRVEERLMLAELWPPRVSRLRADAGRLGTHDQRAR